MKNLLRKWFGPITTADVKLVQNENILTMAGLNTSNNRRLAGLELKVELLEKLLKVEFVEASESCEFTSVEAHYVKAKKNKKS